MAKNRNRTYTNGEITILWQGMECVHATTCYRELREVFDPAKRPWVNPQGAPSARIKDIVERCPSQALTFRWNDPKLNLVEKSHKLFRGNLQDLFPDQESSLIPRIQATINYRPNGPAIISGDFTIFQQVDGREQELRKMQMVSLCRCGASGNQPYCDGTHFKIGFKG